MKKIEEDTSLKTIYSAMYEWSKCTIFNKEKRMRSFFEIQFDNNLKVLYFTLEYQDNKKSVLEIVLNENDFDYLTGLVLFLKEKRNRMKKYILSCSCPSDSLCFLDLLDGYYNVKYYSEFFGKELKHKCSEIILNKSQIELLVRQLERFLSHKIENINY